jgi:hypothetical protein
MANLTPPLQQALKTLQDVEAKADTHQLRSDAGDLASSVSAAIEISTARDEDDDAAIVHVVHHHASEMQAALHAGDLRRVLDHGRKALSALPDGPFSGPKRPRKS